MAELTIRLGSDRTFTSQAQLVAITNLSVAHCFEFQFLTRQAESLDQEEDQEIAVCSEDSSSQADDSENPWPGLGQFISSAKSGKNSSSNIIYKCKFCKGERARKQISCNTKSRGNLKHRISSLHLPRMVDYELALKDAPLNAAKVQSKLPASLDHPVRQAPSLHRRWWMARLSSSLSNLVSP